MDDSLCVARHGVKSSFLTFNHLVRLVLVGWFGELVSLRKRMHGGDLII
jgi:hypothetical protein